MRPMTVFLERTLNNNVLMNSVVHEEQSKYKKFRAHSRVNHSCSVLRRIRPYYKSELELKLNSSEILPVNCKFICDSTPD